MTQQWVPKSKVVTKEAHTPVPVQPIARGTPAPVHPVVNSDDDGGWRVVSRKTRDKGKRPLFQDATVSNTYQVLLEEDPEEQEEGEASGDPSGSGENPYLS